MFKFKFRYSTILFCLSTTLYAQKLYEDFKNPPLSAKPRALWTWVDGNFDKESITFELKEAKAKGMGGFDIWDVNHVQDEKKIVPKGNAFMNEAYTDALAHAINEATKLDLELGLIVSSGWNAGGAWTKAENATMGMYRTEIIVDDKTKSPIKLPFPKLPLKIGKSKNPDSPIIELDKNGLPVFYKDVAVLAYPIFKDSVIKDLNMVKDISAFMDKSGNLIWKIPKGKWKIERMVCANTGQPMIMHTPNSKGPMIDHFNPKATEIHIQYFIDKLLAKLGTFDGKSLKYLYSDSYEVTGELWTPLMIEEFEKQFGYSMKPFLPVFKGFTIIDKESSERFLYDFRQLLSDLIISSHYKKAKEVCNKYGLGYVAEAAGPGKPLHNCPFESLKSSGVLTHPRGEFWHNSKENIDTNIDILQVIKGVSSASHIYNQNIVDAEAFTSAFLWQESLNELKPDADKAFCEGLNRIVFHTFPHVPKLVGKPGYIYGFGTQISVTQPWWQMAKPFMDYLGRCSAMLQKGNFVGDVLYYYGDEAPNFVPNKTINVSLGFGYDYDVTNSDVILNKLTVKDGKLMLPHGQQYAVLVLPNLEEMNIEVLIKLEKLIADGAIVIGKKPSKSTGYKNYLDNDKKIDELAAKIWGNIDGKTILENNYGKGKIIFGKDIKTVLQSLNIIQDFDAGNQKTLNSVDYIHRKTQNEEIYFVCNTKNIAQKLTTTYRVNGKTPQLWNPLTGEKSAVDFITNSNSTSLILDLEANGSVFVIFSNENESISKIIQNPLGKIAYSDTLKNAWKLDFPANLGAPKTANYTKLTDLSISSVDGIKFFSGIVKYETEYEFPKNITFENKNIFIDLGDVAVAASVTINGQNLGVFWKYPFVIDTKNSLKTGKNTIQIEVANRWTHRLIGDSRLPKEKRITNTNITKLPNGWMYLFENLPNSEYGFLPSGLIGPVKVHFINLN
ncbi:MAG: hypothetical protein EAZ27_09115 [Cytophagales bacterium]|nr:MAG: hypothetical protein EAZ27_09115 [Cytophagales bacterium]